MTTGNMTTGTKIKVLREKRNWGQEVIAEKLGITQPAVSKLESDSSNLSLKQADKLGELFGVDPGYFFPSNSNTFINHSQSVNQVNGVNNNTDPEIVEAIYRKQQDVKDELLHERFIRNNELKEQNNELKAQLAKLQKELDDYKKKIK
ncbi:helix-turn-helix domain-containing protein [Pedobacter sp. ASV28]|uniref:helix-turn-helix domain-containing protein n=1 Tax=Pedobacter sp. ASV28 TaxID=2795123 RepID=UPI0018EB2F07|nr:helix-turn-helix transcriptional regulator [Pedobacter sp. ASV28]